MIKVNIVFSNNSCFRYISNPNTFIKTKVTNLNKKLKKFKKKNIFLTLLFSGDAEIKKLNKRFRNKNKSTDVLSFPFYKKNELKKKLKSDREIYLGDIIVNINKIKNKNNKAYFKSELNKLWIHGLIHLFGYDHIKDKEDYANIDSIREKLLNIYRN